MTQVENPGWQRQGKIGNPMEPADARYDKKIH